MSEQSEKIDKVRRAILGASVLGGAAVSAGASFTLAQTGNNQQQGGNELLLKGGYILSMDPEIGDLTLGDVHIRDGEIVAVAASIDAPQAELIDAENTVIMPGFVDTHWHMWISLWRGMINDASAYFAFRNLLEVYTLEDHYTAVRYAALEALNAGITTCHNWAHGVRGYDDVEAEMQALVDTGIRAKMGYMGNINGELTSIEELNRALDWIADNGQGRIGLGMLAEGAPELLEAQVANGRSLGLRPITDHDGALSRPDITGAEFIYTHGTDVTAEQIALMAEREVKVALCPTTDPMIGAGLPPVYALLNGGVPLENISYSVDVNAQTPVDPFTSARTLVNAGRIQQAQTTNLGQIAMSGPQWLFSYRDALYVGTYGGANVLGLANQIGSLRPGKRADVIMVRTDMINMLPTMDTNMTLQLVQHALPANIDTVIVDGRLRKRGGQLLGVNLQQVMAETAAAQEGIRERAGIVIDQSL